MKFISQMRTDKLSKEFLQRFLEEPFLKLLIIPQKPSFESISCIALDHAGSAENYGIIERVEKIMKAFKEHPYIFYATQGRFTLKEDTPYTRYQVEQTVSYTIH